MLGLPWFNIEETIQGLREIEMLEWICYVRPIHPHWDGPKTYLYQNFKKYICEGSPNVLE